MRRSSALVRAVIVVGAAAFAAAVAPAAPPGTPGAVAAAAEVPPVVFGEKFPAWTYTNANDGAGGAARIDLAAVLGRSPVVFYFWAPGSLRSDKVLLEVQSLVEQQGAGKAVLYAIVSPLAAAGVEAVKAKARELKLRVPVLWDDGLRLMQQLRVMNTPYVAIVDKTGILRLTNGVSLRQPLEYKLSLEEAVKRVCATGQIGTFGELPRYDPVTEFVGKKPPEFELPEASDGIPRRSTTLMASDRLNVLIFWSIDCGHCVKFMPKFNAWLRDHGDGLNVVSLAKSMNDAMKTKTSEFAKFNGFVFPTLIDHDFSVAQQFQVTATPTILVLRPDGVVDSIMPAGEENFDTFFGAKRREILRKS